MSSLTGKFQDRVTFTDLIETVGPANRIAKLIVCNSRLTLTAIVQGTSQRNNDSITTRITYPRAVFTSYNFEAAGRNFLFFDWCFLSNISTAMCGDEPLEVIINCCTPAPRFALRRFGLVVAMPILNNPPPNFMPFPVGVGLKAVFHFPAVERLFRHCSRANERLRVTIFPDSLKFRCLGHPRHFVLLRKEGGNVITGRGLLVQSDIELRVNCLPTFLNAAMQSTRTEIRIPPVQPPRPLIFRCYNVDSFVDFVIHPFSQADLHMQHETDEY